MTQSDGSLARVTTRQLDKLAADAGRAAAPAFVAAGWTWASNEPYTPDGPAIAVRVRGMMNDLDPGMSLSSGRLTVYRHDEDDGVEQVSVTLDLGMAYGDDV